MQALSERSPMSSAELASEGQVFGHDAELVANSGKRKLNRLERDLQRGYSINVKQVVLAFCVEFWIIGLIVIGTYLLISDSGERGHVSSQEIFSALLLPAALAMVELARVPLAIAVRTQSSFPIKFFAALGVLAAITVTSFSLSQIAWKTFDIRTAEVTRAHDKLAAVQTKKSDVQEKFNQYQKTLDSKIQERNTVDERLSNLQQQLTKISTAVGNACSPVVGPDGRLVVGEDGRPLSKCAPTATVNQTQLNAIKAQIANTQKDLDVAKPAVKQAEDELRNFDVRQLDAELATADAEYRAAVNQSQLHSYAAMVTGKAVADVSEADVKSLEKYLIIIPCIAAAFASTLLAVTAVRRIRPKTSVATIPDEAAAYLFGPLVTAIRQEARDAVAAAVNKSSG
jgi:Skp family chaperone for outer membrane proteins